MNIREQIERLRKDFPKDPRIAGSPEMEWRWKTASTMEKMLAVVEAADNILPLDGAIYEDADKLDTALAELAAALEI